MGPLNLKVMGGTVCIPKGPHPGEIGIRNERIAGIASPGVLSQAREEADATGKVVMPGCIDVHTHFREPGYEYKEDFTTAHQSGSSRRYNALRGDDQY